MQLSPREKEVVKLYSIGASDKQIAHSLGVSLHTVKLFGANLREKLGAVNRAHAVNIAIYLKQLD